MRQAMIFVCLALLVLFGSTSVASGRGPANNPLSLELVGACADGSSYDAFSPAAGHAVIDTLTTSVQVTVQLSVSDPNNELGGSFSVTGPSFAALNAAGLLTTCTGTVVGTTAVTFIASVIKTPTPRA